MRPLHAIPAHNAGWTIFFFISVFVLERGICLVFTWFILGGVQEFASVEQHWQLGTQNNLVTFCFPFGMCTLAENPVWNKMHLTAKHLTYLVNIFLHVPKGKPEQYGAKQCFLCFLLKHIKLSSILDLTTFLFYLIQKIFRSNHGSLFGVAVHTAVLIGRDQETRVFHAVATRCVRGEQESPSTGQHGDLDKRVLCYRRYWHPEFRVPLRVPQKWDVQIYWTSLISYLVELSHPYHQSGFILKNPHVFRCHKICKWLVLKVSRYASISYPTYSTFIIPLAINYLFSPVLQRYYHFATLNFMLLTFPTCNSYCFLNRWRYWYMLN